MSSTSTITAAEMRGINRTAVLEIIRREGPIARTQIAESLQISLMTVMRIVETLQIEDLIRPTGTKEWSGGRKRPLLEFNATGHLVIGIDMNQQRLYGVVADLAGNILTEETINNTTSGKEEYELLVKLIDHLLKFAQGTEKHIRGIGVGAPWITYSIDGKIPWTPSQEWRDFPLKENLEERFRLPVVLDNDVNLSALGEMWFGVGQNCKNLILMIVENGIGAGIIIDGAVYRGSHFAAGEIGYLLPDRSMLGVSRVGYGALESLASGKSIVERARVALQTKLSDEELDGLSAAKIFDAYEKYEKWVQPIMHDVFDYLAQAVATLAVCFDPDVIVLSGDVSRLADVFTEEIYKRIEGGVIPLRPKIVASRLGSRAIVMGTIIETLYNTTDFYTVRKLS
jgi:glucokinase